MKMPTLITRKKKLRAATARRSRNLGLPEEMDYEQMAEPNMKLSRALLIVLVLHIVAVAGIVAFNTIKTRENFAPATPETIAPATAAATPAVAATSAVAAPNESSLAAASTETKADQTSSAPAKSSVKDSGKIYTVVRGDNPVTIARHLRVAEADLLELNQITDPRKLQINQKLHIPERTANTHKRSSD
ncbi:MAG TPA: LysM domain-containing protein [Chthoniobacterales bacterium]|nr:LysM domain-containing protein [Chthoniobacterales bacterium]